MSARQQQATARRLRPRPGLGPSSSSPPPPSTAEAAATTAAAVSIVHESDSDEHSLDDGPSQRRRRTAEIPLAARVGASSQRQHPSTTQSLQQQDDVALLSRRPWTLPTDEHPYGHLYSSAFASTSAFTLDGVDGDAHDASQALSDQADLDLDLPPGNQQAVPRSFLLDVATPTPHATAARQPSRASQLTSSQSLRARSTSRSDAGPVSPSSSGSSSGSPPTKRKRRHTREPASPRHATKLESNIGQGSLHRGIVVPSSDLEDNVEDADHREDQTESPQRQMMSEGSFEAMLRRKMPTFTSALLNAKTDITVDATQEAVSRPTAPRQPAAGAQIDVASDARGLDTAAVDEVYDEEAHKRDSAEAAAHEVLIVQPRPSARRRNPLSGSLASTSASPDRTVRDSVSKDEFNAQATNTLPESARSQAGLSLSPTKCTPVPPPALHELSHRFAYDAPQPEARAQRCEFVQIMPWHTKLSAKGANGRKKPADKKRGRSDTRATTPTAQRNGKENEPQADPTTRDGTMQEDRVDLSSISIDLVRPLERCPLCTERFPKSRSGPAKVKHMEVCTRARSASGRLASADTEKAEGTATSTTPVQGNASATPAVSSTPSRDVLTPTRIQELINAELDTLIHNERQRQAAQEASRTLFARVVGDEGAQAAAEAAAKAKEARDALRKVHLDNLYDGQGELPPDYKPRKRRKMRGKRGKDAEGKGKARAKQDQAAMMPSPNKALVRLMARRDAEEAERRDNDALVALPAATVASPTAAPANIDIDIDIDVALAQDASEDEVDRAVLPPATQRFGRSKLAAKYGRGGATAATAVWDL